MEQYYARLRRSAYHLRWERTLAEPQRVEMRAARQVVRDEPSRRAERNQKVQARRSKKRGLLLRLKESARCLDCGGAFPACCFDFDHRDPATKDRRAVSISQLAGLVTEEELRAEIAKCDLVCANCHRIRTQKQRTAGLFRWGGRKKDRSHT